MKFALFAAAAAATLAVSAVPAAARVTVILVGTNFKTQAIPLRFFVTPTRVGDTRTWFQPAYYYFPYSDGTSNLSLDGTDRTLSVTNLPDGFGNVDSVSFVMNFTNGWTL